MFVAPGLHPGDDAEAKTLADNPTPEDDAALMQRIGEGDRRAFSQLVGRHAARSRGLAENTGLDRAAAEDVVQEVFLRLWQQPHRFNPQKSRFTTWLYRVVVNRAIDARRRRRDLPLADGYDAPDPRMDSARNLASRQFRHGVHARLDRLPDRQRRAIVLVNLQELSNKDAAEIMDMNIKAFESLLLRARRRLAIIFADDPIDPPTPRDQL